MRAVSFALASIAVSLAVPAAAAPTYMTCIFTNSEGTTSEVKITADEGAGTVSVLVPKTGYTGRMAGTFTPDRVVFKDDMLDYGISRVDLTATRTIRMINSTDKGKCSVDPAPKRAF